MHCMWVVHGTESENDSRAAPVSEVESHLDLLYLISLRFQFSVYLAIFQKGHYSHNICNILSAQCQEHIVKLICKKYSTVKSIVCIHVDKAVAQGHFCLDAIYGIQKLCTAW